MEVFQFLYRVKDTLTSDDFALLLHILSTDKFSTHIVQISQQFKPLFRDVARQHLQPEFNSMMEKAQVDPKYESTISRVADAFMLLRQIHAQFPRAEFTRFVDCYEFENDHVQHETILQNIDQFKKRLSPPLKERLNMILSQQHEELDYPLQLHQHQEVDGVFFNDDGMTMLENDGMIDNEEEDMNMFQEQSQQQPMSQQQLFPSSQEQNLLQNPIMVTLFQHAYNIFQNDSLLCQQFFDIIHTNYIHSVDFSESILHIYRWIQTVNPNLWSSLSPILEQMILYVDSTTETYDSYEDFVQKNFMNQDDQLYLNNEIEQARVQHIFSKLSI
ncbi:unnamed protein product [Cunninghamella echinulata]